MMAESSNEDKREAEPSVPIPAVDVVTLPESLQSDSMVTALARLKEKISRLELDRQTAESDMQKLAEETSLFRAQMQGFDRERRGFDRVFQPTVVPPPALSSSQLSIGPRHFDGKETDDELFFVPEAKMVAQSVSPETRVVSSTLDIVENRCFALEQEFRLMRELLEDADRNAMASRELLIARQSPVVPELRQKRGRRDRLEHQLSALLGPPEPAAARPDSARKQRGGPKDVAGNLRPHSAPSKSRKPRSRPTEELAGEAQRRKARAIVSDLHLEVEGLKEEHRVLAQRLAVESNRAQKALLVADLERVVRTMEQKGEQMGRIKTYVRRANATRLVVRSKDSLVTSGAAVAREREMTTRRPRKVAPTLSMGDVRWTSAP